MEVESISGKNLAPARARILENIKELGFEAQNQQLFQHGFTKLSQNLKYLKIYNGDVNQIISQLGEKSKTKETFYKELEKDHGPRKPRKERASRGDSPDLQLKELTEWPAHIRTLYLDGNNMLFVEDAIRKLVLSRKSKLAEKVLADLALNFAQTLGTFNVILIYDSTKQISSQDVVAANGNTVKFSVVSSTPEFTNSDDALVAWSEKLGDKANECFFVTSDRGLQVRLAQNGVENISKTKRWFTLVKNSIGEDKYRAVLSQTE